MLAGVDLQVDIVQYGGVAAGDVHVLQVEKVGHAFQGKCFAWSCSGRGYSCDAEGPDARAVR